MSAAHAVPLWDAINDRSTRARACEMALILHALTDPGAVASCSGLMLSEPAAIALGVICEQPEARMALVSTVRVALTFRHAIGDLTTQTCSDTMRLVREAAAVPAADLAALGPLEHVTAMLRDVRAYPSTLRIVA